ncbi:2,3,4,5-tetrahydropyridine-2,6-carboxylate N-succinyltransferase [Helicobacter sp. 12S02232-10]|uniref:2,3,4,5-tetrahydropyridine-2,6-carboxylate N-succinyltransferase n=1 Tax=Helicobacter sp. 12S02232-10 TaxID=1476197 RepID=UPI000BA62DE1|nr:2,3,4,5-tetrahydropyridine-2,6-carboxylate N-succinyltransferase [Helicobacter sp. 12S02232-10]PAF49819.1 2,3,4,5-tetrahydropyridine-2,6-carboxylate N-succinyltransferase [Helicobacter sp. 12S02232-10]
MTDKFKTFVDNYQKSSAYKTPLGFGIAKVDIGEKSKKTLCATYPILNWTNENLGSYAVFMNAITPSAQIISNENECVYGIDEDFIYKSLELYTPFLNEAIQNKMIHKNIQVVLELKKALDENRLRDKNGEFLFRFAVIYKDTKCESVETAYLKLLALSLGKAKLRSLILDGIFGLLQNVAWSGNKPYELEWLRENEIALKMRGIYPHIDFVDKFPRYLMQVIPQYDNIRILDTAKTRFGAYLGTGGYTQMPGASYVNFNAGALGACMNEGRISSSVIIGEGTDIGGGASILGVLSGGNSAPISIGKNCLLGVNSSTGISLGDGCIVDGGIAVLAGTIFEISETEAKKIAQINPDFSIHPNNLYKGKELSGKNGVHFRQESTSGKMIAFRSARKIELNDALH